VKLNQSFLVFALLVMQTVHAATLTVSTSADSGNGSLRNALKNSRSGDIIKFSLPANATITLTSGELLVSKSVSIVGPGAGSLFVNGNAAARVFHINPGGSVTIAGLTIGNGLAAGKGWSAFGGGIYNDHAALTVSSCTLAGNVATDGGGAIFNNGTSSRPTSATARLTVVNCTFSGNSAHHGGGIESDGSGASATATILGSTFNGNYGDTYGGALANGPGSSLNIRNCTISGNAAGAGFGGGGIENFGGTVTVLCSTLVGNSVPSGDHGAGILTEGGTLTIGSTIFDNSNSPGDNIHLDATGAGTVTSLGFNLHSPDFSNALFNQPTDRAAYPMLGPLQNNGGPTWTHAPLPGSPAIDQGFNFSGSASDQRGGARTVDYSGVANAPDGDGTDIGAVEVQ
jgi:hypothetical protein